MRRQSTGIPRCWTHLVMVPGNKLLFLLLELFNDVLLQRLNVASVVPSAGLDIAGTAGVSCMNVQWRVDHENMKTRNFFATAKIWVRVYSKYISFNSLLFFRMAKNVYNWVKSSRTVLGTIFAALQFFRFPWCPTSLWHFGGSLEYGEGSYRFRLPTYPYDDQTSHLSVFTQKMTLTKSPVLLALVMKAFRDSRSTRN